MAPPWAAARSGEVAVGHARKQPARGRKLSCMGKSRVPRRILVRVFKHNQERMVHERRDRESALAV